MIISIKPHSTIQKFFRGTDLKADISSYADVLQYLQSLHPDFIKYVKKQAENNLQEVFTFLDKNLREISKDEMFMRKAKEDDVIYIVPSIVGGGGKRGVFAILAIAAALITLPFWAPAALATMPLLGSAAAGTLVTVGSLASHIGLTLALMGVSMLFTPKQKAAESSRDNDAFGSLVNSTASGTPIALHYGLVRVGGQLITGYTKTVEGTKDQLDIKMSQIITLN